MQLRAPPWIPFLGLLLGLLGFGAPLEGAPVPDLSLRCFLGLSLADEPAEALLQARETLPLPERAKLEERANLHLTLRFLGDLSLGTLDQLSGDLAELSQGISPFVLRVQGLGTFPYRGKEVPRVLWGDVSGDVPALNALAKEVTRVSSQTVTRSDDFGFRPHITLARLPYRGQDPGLAEAIQGLRERDFGALAIESFHLYVVLPQGQGYSILKSFPLAAKARAKAQPKASAMARPATKPEDQAH